MTGDGDREGEGERRGCWERTVDRDRGDDGGDEGRDERGVESGDEDGEGTWNERPERVGMAADLTDGDHPGSYLQCLRQHSLVRSTCHGFTDAGLNGSQWWGWSIRRPRVERG